jgi:hypothetical protein
VFNGTFQSSGAVGTGIQAELGLGFDSTGIVPETSRLFVFQWASGVPFVDVRTEATIGLAVVPAGRQTVNASCAAARSAAPRARVRRAGSPRRRAGREHDGPSRQPTSGARGIR